MDTFRPNNSNERFSVCTVPQVEHQQHNIILSENYPEINLRNDNFNTSSHKIPCIDMSSRNLLVPVSESVLKRITCIFFESGYRAALVEACHPQTASKQPVLAKTANFIVEILNQYRKLKIKIFPHAIELNLDNIAKYAAARDWKTSPIRYMAWHPHSFKLAVASNDDAVRIYTDPAIKTAVLKCPEQNSITSLAWRPCCAGELAVGCEKGIYIWRIDNSGYLSRPSSQNQLIRHPDNLPITSLQWNKIGTLLATGSIGDSHIVIWDLDSMHHTIVKRWGPTTSLLKWSPDNSWLLAGTVDETFCVWNVDSMWKLDRWSLCTGYIQSACWSPCSTFLLIVSTTKPILYRIQFRSSSLFVDENEREKRRDILPIADLSEYDANTTTVGGMPQQLVWDPNGDYLVITFKNSNSIAVFKTKITKYDLQLTPGFYLTGNNSTEYPSFVCFQSVHRTNNKIVLTVAWSSGRVQYYPLAKPKEY